MICRFTWLPALGFAFFAACDGGTTQAPMTSGPAAPSELEVTPLTGGGHLVWKDNASDEDGFEIERRTSGEFARIASVVFDIRQYHDADVTSGASYEYRVRATKGTAASAYSNVASLFVAPPSGDAGVAADDAAITADDAGTTPTADAGAVSFARDIVPILQQSCGSGDNGCHSRVAYLGDRNQDCRGWLSLENVPLGSRHPNTGAATGCADRTLHERLTGLDAWMCDPRRRYVVAGRTADSQLHAVISGRSAIGGTCNKAPGVPLGAMPPPTSRYQLSAASAQLITDWIAAGALDN